MRFRLVMSLVVTVLITACSSRCRAQTTAPQKSRVIRVAVYDDAGVGPSVEPLLKALAERPDLRVERLKAEAIRAGKLAGYNVLIHPGGSGGKQGKSLEEKGRDQVRAFVQAGGGYVGVCAGAYLATCDYTWSLHILNARVIDKAHWARGYGDVALTLSAKGGQLLGTRAERLTIYYHQGPLLAPAGNARLPVYEALARFEGEIARNGAPAGVMKGTTAVAAAPFGKGRVLCFSPHPEKTDGLHGLLHHAIAWASDSDRARADEADILKNLKDKGARSVETKGVVTQLLIDDCSKFSAADFRQVGQLAHLKSLSFGAGLTDQSLALLTDLNELESLQTNLMQVTDDGLKALARLKNLRNVKFFHPAGKPFTGAGLAHLADLPNLERLTVAGALAFGDEGMAAVGKLTRLKEFRCWHAGVTQEGVKRLKELKNLQSLNLGQRLTYKPPSCPSDETLAILAELPALESLQLSEARLTLTALRQVQQLARLKTLTLEGIDIPEADVERLKKDLPRVSVKWTKPSDVYLKRIRALFDEK